MVKRNHKTLKKSLTASRKTEAQTTRPDQRHREAAGVAEKAAPARGRSKPDWMDCVDQIHGSCATLAMLGQLMENHGDEALEPEALREAGSMLIEQARQLRAALADLEEAR
jgi:hypothetical protein